MKTATDKTREILPRRLECAHVDTCLPDYWRGDSRAHVSVAVHHGMHLADVRRAILAELGQGAVSGSDRLAFLLSADWVGPENAGAADLAYSRAVAAVNRMRPATPRARRLFLDLEKQPAGDYDDSPEVYAYFVFVEGN